MICENIHRATYFYHMSDITYRKSSCCSIDLTSLIHHSYQGPWLHHSYEGPYFITHMKVHWLNWVARWILRISTARHMVTIWVMDLHMGDRPSRKSMLQRAATSWTHCNTRIATRRDIWAIHFLERAYCNILQHAAAATCCNTLQHAATRCNTHIATRHDTSLPYQRWTFSKKHTATHCNTLQHAATHCNTLQHTNCYQARHIIGKYAVVLCDRVCCNSL